MLPALLAAARPVGHGEVCGGERERHEEHGLDSDELAPNALVEGKVLPWHNEVNLTWQNCVFYTLFLPWQ